MASLNKVFLIGNLTRDPELRVTPKGTAICQFGIAVNRQFKDDSGATRDETTFVDVEAWGKQGELVSKYLGKAYRYYADEGRALGSVWSDCPAMVANTPLRKESTGYPTQKPEKLLDRIVRAASRPGGLVVDPFCGSGTTLVAAAKAGRRAVGLDVGPLAIATTTERIRAAGFPLDAR